MTQSYVISGTKGGPGIDNTAEVVLEADEAGNPTKVIGVDQPCELTKNDKETLSGLGIDIAKSAVSAEDAAARAPQAGSDTAAAAPIISS